RQPLRGQGARRRRASIQPARGVEPRGLLARRRRIVQLQRRRRTVRWGRQLQWRRRRTLGRWRRLARRRRRKTVMTRERSRSRPRRLAITTSVVACLGLGGVMPVPESDARGARLSGSPDDVYKTFIDAMRRGDRQELTQ